MVRRFGMRAAEWGGGQQAPWVEPTELTLASGTRYQEPTKCPRLPFGSKENYLVFSVYKLLREKRQTQITTFICILMSQYFLKEAGPPMEILRMLRNLLC